MTDVEHEPDSIAWMRARWERHGTPAAPQFAAMVSLLRATAVISDAVDTALKPLSLTRTSYFVLVTLQMTDGGARPLGQLSKRLLVHPTTVTMLVDQLEKAGAVLRRPHPTDRRTVLAELTPVGRRLVEEATMALAEVGFGLPDTDDATADRLEVDLRSVRRSLGDRH
ncbi:MAG: MarR family winged helix-turn-helix transcriptional regulator [Sporichthyaceae bacterium]